MSIVGDCENGESECLGFSGENILTWQEESDDSIEKLSNAILKYISNNRRKMINLQQVVVEINREKKLVFRKENDENASDESWAVQMYSLSFGNNKK